MGLYKLFSEELGICYFEQNEDYTDEEIEETFIEDKTILEGELMGMLMQVDELEDLDE